MKTNIYNKKEHLEGFVGNTKEAKVKSDAQKAYERGNEGNEVPTYGTPDETLENIDANRLNARDGFDNTGTQGADSLSDDAYNSHERKQKNKNTNIK